ncbi:MAG: aldehyde dehydrogenase family protein [Abditibacteriales bacterium]|nr:aldehyde dehydrogenase family protein [Abditibacteriales bacterium]MDW8365297.1 aldehyde dehydrogenase family protein [Abditibacteriales bacterium]
MSDLTKNFINGRWVESPSGATFESRNPATGEVLGVCTRSNAEDVEAAVAAAVNAFDRWRKTPAPRRAEILFRAAEIMLRRKEDLAQLVTNEMGKVIAEGRGDVQEAIDMTYYMAGEGRRQFGLVAPVELPNKFGMCLRDPIGVVGAITPWNFPIAIPCWKLMPALVLGNTVVFKPAEDTPLCAAALIAILEEAGLPPGVVNMVLGYGEEVGAPLVEHPQVPCISFTGSNEVGRQIAIKCAHLGKRLHLEMGGKNAIIVMDDADLDLAMDGIVWSAFGTSGQRCTAASRIITHNAVKNELSERLVDRAAQLRLGYGLLPNVDMGPVVNEQALEKIHGYVMIGVQEGAKKLVGGERATDGDLARGYFFKPTVFEATPDMRISQEEIFGPVTNIIPVRSLEEAIAVNNHTRYGLSTAIYTRDVNRAFTAIRDVSTGILYINAGTIGAEVHFPFGGTRGTGNGHREAGVQALDTFSEWKSVYVDYSGRLQRAQIDVE